jgi:hypothetical protein
MKMITVSAKQYEDTDDCLRAAADDYVSEHPEAAGYDLNARWVGGDDGERAEIALDVPGDDSVVVEIMPDQHRGSHRAARNWGTYPHNGAERYRTDAETAEDLCDEDGDGYNRVVQGADPSAYPCFWASHES